MSAPRGRGRFRFQLVRLSRDGVEVELCASPINTGEDYTRPTSLKAGLEKTCGTSM